MPRSLDEYKINQQMKDIYYAQHQKIDEDQLVCLEDIEGFYFNKNDKKQVKEPISAEKNFS